MKLRGILALALVCLALLLADPIQRLVIAPWVRLAPSRRIPVLARWQRLMAHTMLFLVGRVGGARIPELPSLPGRPGSLVLMNHQSLLDIPLVVASIEGSYPRIVTRKRYMRWIPLISHMTRLYQYPVVDPSANAGSMRRSLNALTRAARETDVPLVVFPEGTRTRDGNIGRFKSNGLRQILAQRPWTVHVLVADGFWQRAKFKQFLAGVGDIEGGIRLLGPLHWTDPDADADAFLRDVRKRMIDCLSDMRAGALE